MDAIAGLTGGRVLTGSTEIVDAADLTGRTILMGLAGDDSLTNFTRVVIFTISASEAILAKSGFVVIMVAPTGVAIWECLSFLQLFFSSFFLAFFSFSCIFSFLLSLSGVSPCLLGLSDLGADLALAILAILGAFGGGTNDSEELEELVELVELVEINDRPERKEVLDSKEVILEIVSIVGVELRISMTVLDWPFMSFWLKG